MSKKITTAVFPVAGLGTRFLPATKSVPKEMLTIVDRPVIQLAVDEAREAGIEHFVFVTGRNKAVIEDHFDKQFELEATLQARGKTAELAALSKDLPAAGQCSFTRQQEPLGLGHAVWCAREIVGDKPFALLLPDMFIHAKPGSLSQMMDVYNQTSGNIIALEDVPNDQVHNYGVVGVSEAKDNRYRINQMVEKPKAENAPSNLIISGRYILQPEIFAKLAKQKPGAGNEIQLTDAMIHLMADQDFFGLHIQASSYDCGNKIGFLAANVALALERDDIADGFKQELKRLIKEHGGL